MLVPLGRFVLAAEAECLHLSARPALTSSGM
jgi:hypothetical protein